MNTLDKISEFQKRYRSYQYFAFNPIIARNTSTETAIILAVLVGHENYELRKKYNSFINNQRFFTLERKYIEQKTGLKYSRQKKSTETLIEIGILETKHTFGNKLMYKIVWEALLKKLDMWSVNHVDDEYVPSQTFQMPIEETIVEKDVDENFTDSLDEMIWYNTMMNKKLSK